MVTADRACALASSVPGSCRAEALDGWLFSRSVVSHFTIYFIETISVKLTVYICLKIYNLHLTLHLQQKLSPYHIIVTCAYKIYIFLEANNSLFFSITTPTWLISALLVMLERKLWL